MAAVDLTVVGCMKDAFVLDLQVPPAGAFSWRPGGVLVKATEEKVDGWQFNSGWHGAV